ncbi:MAG: sulfite exporter TauE/SafE family protein [Bacteroidales bacterium]
MNTQLIILGLTAASLGFFHTLFGPDHYLPFVVLSKARKWSRAKTLWITALCGIGHVGSSVLIGFVGIAIGVELSKLEYFESFRGHIAGWLLIGFGLLYALWGLKKAFKNKPHTHSHFHFDGRTHTHVHTHFEEHTHFHSSVNEEYGGKIKYKTLTPWLLFVIFVFGPCEPLIPLLMFPALQHSPLGVISVTFVFSIVTISTMLAVVLAMTRGLEFIKMEKFERYTHALAGGAIFFSGLAIQFWGL